ncbi:DUF5131 family protein [Aquitalea aquatilis]|uniref:DUF5131 family protein n=1 Tax=Aquitalea aquatilis TaxID=1537400 RepID=UPI0010BD68DE|nr:phage Gp37/Gp68 family protein [Aquitalea aquatilis]
MSDKTGIEWTDATWNPVTGCAKVSQGCKHCYALRDWKRLSAMPNTVYHGREFTDVMCHPERLDQPMRWSRPRRIFVNSMSDLFHPDVPFEFIAAVFAVMSVTTRHTYQVLTKRPERMVEFFQWVADGAACFDDDRISEHMPEGIDWKPAKAGRGGYDNCGPAFPYANVWLGVSVEDQATADERIPLLLQTPAAVRWISAEPLLGPVDLMPMFEHRADFFNDTGVDWVVVGGESGPKARPMHPDWAYRLKDHCAQSGVPFLFKQWGEWVSAGQPAFGTVKGEVRHIRSDGSFWGEDLPKDENADVLTVVKVGKRSAGRLLGGREWNEYPEVKA